ncbi:hypothetical protein DM860_001374 [Cuscuta australis]|uniref:Elongin-C n=1 Tax=Cuscuta australis TaxID=267555 RepID=A0A328EA71_9ASTE|nr:hypothetical protein DM860_001374 [Cuscuta australis]
MQPSSSPVTIFLAKGGFAETEHREVTFPEISSTILEKICQYFYWHLQYARSFFYVKVFIQSKIFFSSSNLEVAFAIALLHWHN